MTLKRAKRIIAGFCCLVILLVSWLITVNAKSKLEKQAELIWQAKALMDEGIYVRAVPLLEEAAGYKTELSAQAEEELKKAYLSLIETRGYRRRLINLLEEQMRRPDASPLIFKEAAEFYLQTSKTTDALAALRAGIGKTGDELLVDMYEKNRYVYETNRTTYDSLTAICGSTIQVRVDGLWGLASSDGILLIPCEYEKISTYSAGRAIVKKDGEIYAINIDNNRIAKLRERATDFGNYADDRIPLLIDGTWKRATGEFVLGTAAFEEFGMYSGGYAAAKTEGKWGVVDIALNWLIPAEYDEIIQDELGRCYARETIFARKDGKVYLFSGGLKNREVFDDAKPFSNEGYAAVKRNGKWGFIDTEGSEKIGFIFDDALSFGQHLAAVKLGGLWGYISLSGQTVIEHKYLEAKSFSNGSAPVLSERGWQFITLLEYKGKAGI